MREEGWKTMCTRLIIAGLTLCSSFTPFPQRNEGRNEPRSLLEAVDDLDLEGVDHGLDVGRSEGTFLFDALDDFGAVVSRCGDELRVVEDVAGLDVLAANNVVG